eukprot:CAMPEP_0119121682 /NCGR_PEP_ID=MMETSP1310-20130426/2193_1 /TAXON_ID=464262 /ORGANISM="Genus nov. species nov., Strain RCC2339" /LENGTH=202 /DNA_ID=CAMNT_0007111257 /DNA_START=180 /DNA_END=784 /DNA_ORIENTATION=+
MSVSEGKKQLETLLGKRVATFDLSKYVKENPEVFCTLADIVRAQAGTKGPPPVPDDSTPGGEGGSYLRLGKPLTLHDRVGANYEILHGACLVVGVKEEKLPKYADLKDSRKLAELFCLLGTLCKGEGGERQSPRPPAPRPLPRDVSVINAVNGGGAASSGRGRGQGASHGPSPRRISITTPRADRPPSGAAAARMAQGGASP